MADNTATTVDDSSDTQVAGDSDGTETGGSATEGAQTETYSGDEEAGATGNEGSTEE